ncbi:hypothetical protein PUN28_016810 [Cardiocondyla obscurior]|uniref:Uncharacterized protein n=1 Tax=Cardiocondyla obscurior TaxID=286306 RepID=A0AAW2ESP9_9HYME
MVPQAYRSRRRWEKNSAVNKMVLTLDTASWSHSDRFHGLSRAVEDATVRRLLLLATSRLHHPTPSTWPTSLTLRRSLLRKKKKSSRCTTLYIGVITSSFLRPENTLPEHLQVGQRMSFTRRYEIFAINFILLTAPNNFLGSRRRRARNILPPRASDDPECLARGWKHARVDPHVNCFIPRRLHSARRIRERNALTSSRARRGAGMENLLVYERDMTAAPRTLYYFAPFGGRLSPPPINALGLRTWIFDVLGKLPGDVLGRRAKGHLTYSLPQVKIGWKYIYIYFFFYVHKQASRSNIFAWRCVRQSMQNA